MTLENQLKIPKDAAVLAVCMGGLNRSPKLADILRTKGYPDVDYAAATGLVIPMPSTQRKIDAAEVIVALDLDIARILKERYVIGTNQRLIELNVPDMMSSKETYGVIIEQIALYLMD